MKKIISITSIPPRFKYLSKTIDSLLSQESVDEIRLNIPKKYKRFPDWDGTLPKLNHSVTIVRCDIDLGPATKILPTAIAYRNTQAQILFCDDDGIFPKKWAKNLFDLQATRPTEAVATWARCIDEIEGVTEPSNPIVKQQTIEKDYRYRFERVLQKIFGYKPKWRPVKSAGYAHLLFGVGGVVVRPDFFNEKSLDIPEEAFLVDDIWLSAHLAENGVKLYAPKRFPMPHESENSTIEALLTLNISQRRRELNINAMKWCQNNLGVWKIGNKKN